MAAEKPSAPPSGALTGRQELPADARRETLLGRRIAYFLSAFVLCAAAGAALVGIEPWLLVALAAGLLFVIIILVQPFWGLLLYTLLFLLRPAELYPVLAPLHLERVIGLAALFGLLLLQYRQERRIVIDASRRRRVRRLPVAAPVASSPRCHLSGSRTARLSAPLGRPDPGAVHSLGQVPWHLRQPFALAAPSACTPLH